MACLPRWALLENWLTPGHKSAPKVGPDREGYWPVYGRVSAGGVCPGTKTGLPCDVMVTVAEVRPGELAVMTLVPE
jgi:hypothetical protein